MKRQLIVYLLLLFWFNGISQRAFQVPSELKKSSTPDSTRHRLLVSTLKYAAERTDSVLLDSILPIAQRFAEQKNNFVLLSEIAYYKGIYHDYSGRYVQAVNEFYAGIATIDTLRYPKEHGLLLLGSGNAWYFKGDLSKAMVDYTRSLRARERAGDSLGIASAYLGMANCMADLRQYDKALDYDKLALGIYERFGNKKMQSWTLNNLGSVYVMSGRGKDAIPWFKESINIKTELNDQYGLSTTFNNLAEIYSTDGQYDSALYYQFRALQTRRSMGDLHELSNSYLHISSTYHALQQYNNALLYLDSAQQAAERIGGHALLFKIYSNKSETFAALGNYSMAYQFQKLSAASKDSVMTQDIARQVSELEKKYETEKKEQQIQLQKTQLSKAHTFRNFMVAVAILVAILALVLFTGYKRKQRTANVLEQQNNTIQEQKKLVEEKNKDITDSIMYAKRIQQALLPTPEIISRYFKESFLVFKPKDIVSGDFFIVEKWGNNTVFAVIDCTGHGVPGAFMTFLAHDLFQEGVNELGITEPAALLNRMRTNITSLFSRRNSDTDVRDGMDAAVCMFNEKTRVLHFSGAMRPLWIIRNSEIIEFAPTKTSVSVTKEEDRIPFVAHEVELQQGDCVYLFTDGYADQFGGEKGKKMKLSGLKAILLEVSATSMQEQQLALETHLAKWKGNYEQVDDVCVFGFRAH